MTTFTGKSEIGVSQTTNAGTTSNDADTEIINGFANPRAETVDNSNAFTITNVASTYLWERNVAWRFTDAGSPPDALITVTVPNTPARGFFGILNDTTQQMEVEKAAQPLASPTLDAGTGGIFYFDGTNVHLLSSAGGAAAFADLTDGFSLAGNGNKVVGVNAGGTALVPVDQAAGAGDALPFVLSPTWRGARVKPAANLTLIDATTEYFIPFDQELDDTDGFHNNATNNTRITIPTGSGIRRVNLNFSARISSFTEAQFAFIQIYKNGTFWEEYGARTTFPEQLDSTTSTYITGTVLGAPVSEADYFELRLLVETDTSININENSTNFAVEVVETTDTVPSLRTVVASLPARWRGARVTKAADQIGLDASTAEVLVTWDRVIRDTDSFFDGANDTFVIPAGVKSVRITATVSILNATTTGVDGYVYVQRDGANFEGGTVARSAFDATSGRWSAQVVTGTIDVAQGQVFRTRMRVNGDTTIDVIAINSWMEIEIVEFNSSTDAVQAYIAIPPEHKGTLLGISAAQSTADGVTEDIVWNVVDEQTLFDPGDGGPPQRFHFGVNWAFADGDVTVGSDQIAETAHGYQTGEGPIRLTTTGTLPAGLALNTNYWIIRVDANNVKFASSRANALVGTAVDITAAAGGGTHTVDQEEYVVIPAGVSRVDLSANIDWASSSVGGRSVTIAKRNASDADVATPGTGISINTANGSAMIHAANAHGLSVSEGDRFAVAVSQTSTGALDVDPSDQTWFSVRVAEEARAITYPGVTVTSPWRGATATLSGDITLIDASAAGYLVPWDAEVEDTDGFHDTVTNNTRMTIPAGVSRVNVTYGVVTNSMDTATSYLQTLLSKNGSTAFIGNGVSRTEINNTNPRNTVTVMGITVVEGDYFEVQLNQDVDENFTLVSASSFFRVEVSETDENAFPPESLKAHVTTADKLVVSSTVAMWIADRRVSLADDFADSLGYAINGPNGGAVVFDVDVEGVKIGEITFSDSTGAAQTATFSTTAAAVEVVNAGERVEIISPANIQSMDDVAFTLRAWRS